MNVGGNFPSPSAARSQLYANGSRPLWVPPTVRGALDDEFDSVTLDPLWKTRDQTTGPTIRTPTVAAYDENVVLTGAATVPKISLHTQGRRSFLTMSLTSTGPAIYQLYKPFTWAAGQVYWCRVARMFRKTGITATAANYSFAMWADAAGVPDNNNRCFISWDTLNGTCRWGIVQASVPSNLSFLNSEGFGFPEYAAIANPAGLLGGSATWYGEFFGDSGHRQLPAAPGSASFSFTPAYIGWAIQMDLGAPMTFQADFIRECAGHPLMHNA